MVWNWIASSPSSFFSLIVGWWLIVRVECVNKQNAVDIVYINYNVPRRSHYLHLRQLRGSVKIPIHFWWETPRDEPSYTVTFYSAVMEFLVVIINSNDLPLYSVTEIILSAHKNRSSIHLTTHSILSLHWMQYKTIIRLQWGVGKWLAIKFIISTATEIKCQLNWVVVTEKRS